MGKGDSKRPQQQEMARSGHTQTDAAHRAEREEARDVPPDSGSAGPVPPENRPGHHPERDQDQPERPPAEGDGEQGSSGQETEDPTVEADEASPVEPGPGDSEGARPE